MDEKEKKNHPPEGMREEKQSGHLKPAAGAGNREEMKVLRIGDRALSLIHIFGRKAECHSGD